MKDCLFCDISNKKSKAYVIDETKDFMAFMDLYPPTFKGNITMPTVLIITKKHYSSNIFKDLPNGIYSKILKYTKKIANAIQEGLKPLRVCMVVEGMELNHFHIKLYPIYKKHYPGYLSTKKSPGNKSIKARDEFLLKTSEKIKNVLN